MVTMAMGDNVLAIKQLRPCGQGYASIKESLVGWIQVSEKRESYALDLVSDDNQNRGWNYKTCQHEMKITTHFNANKKNEKVCSEKEQVTQSKCA